MCARTASAALLSVLRPPNPVGASRRRRFPIGLPALQARGAGCLRYLGAPSSCAADDLSLFMHSTGRDAVSPPAVRCPSCCLQPAGSRQQLIAHAFPRQPDPQSEPGLVQWVINVDAS